MTRVEVFEIVAHPDDDLLFIDPDLAAVVSHATAVRTVVISAGDAGLDASYWKSREAGLRAAYARLAGAPNSWTAGTETAGGKTLIGPRSMALRR